jgi:CRISPR/Cas system CSM-associated protein Csm2 small subunit
MTACDFAKVFAPMARDGKSALEIGQALGIKGDAAKVAQFVSVKASQLRARMAKDAEDKAKKENLSPEDTEKLVAATVAKLPKLKSRGRQSGTAELVSMLDSLLTSVNERDEPPTENAAE